MLSGIAKLLLVITSMAPVLGAFAIIDYVHGGLGWSVFRWVTAASGLLIICLLVLHFARHHVEIERLTAKKIKSADKEVLAFLLAYLLPLLSKDQLDFKAEWITTTYIFLMIGWTVYHSNSFYFNPLLAFAGYHFYEIELETGMQAMLLAKRSIRDPTAPITVVQLFEFTFMEAKEAT